MQNISVITFTVFGGVIMEFEELSAWREGVQEHMIALDVLVNDRKILKKHLENHLHQVFDWDDIEYNKDFTVVSLKWDTNHQPVIKNENLEKLQMDMEIKASYDDCANRIVVIDVYPFGCEGS